MEINLEIKYDELNRDGSRAADCLRRKIFEMYPNGIWEKKANGHRILV
jgi:hypothetical protein